MDDIMYFEAEQGEGIVIGGEGEFTPTDKKNLDLNTKTRHTHENKTVLDGITGEQVNKWDGYEKSKEDTSNKVTELSESSTNEEYPTAKAVTEYVENSEKETAALLKKKSIPYTTATGCTISISDHLEGESVIDCKIYGNSVQNGTPSPDNPVEIQSVGDLVTDEASEYYGKYDIPITVTGKNLIPYPYNYTTQTKSGVTMTYDNGVITLNGTCTAPDNFDLGDIALCANTYTLSANANKAPVNNTYAFVQLYDSKNNQDITVTNSNAQGYKIVTTSVYGNFLYRVRIDKGCVYDNVILRPQLELGSTATSYEPYRGGTKHIYLDEPLRKVGDYADYIDYGNQKVVRKIKELKLESNLKYRLWIYNDKFLGFNLYLNDTVSECMVLSNYFKPVTDNLLPNKHDNSIYVKYLDLFIGTSDWTTTDDFKAWLSDKDVTILYPLITPTEEPISLPELTTPKASVANVSIHTSIQPSNISLTYYKGINKVVDGLGGFWGLDLPLIKTITLEESVASIDILSKAEGIELQEFTVLLFIKALGDVVESNLKDCVMCLRANGGANYFGYKGGYYFFKENNSFAFWHTKIYNKQFALTDLYSGYGNVSSDIPYQGFQGIGGSTPTQYSSYASFFNEQLIDNLNIFISSNDVSRGAIIPQGSMIFLLGR